MTTNHGNVLTRQDNEAQRLIFCQELSGLYVNILYSLMIARISKGYTTSEVSFLMGCRDDKTKKIEQLEYIAGIETIFEFVNAIEGDSMNGSILSEASYSNGFADYKLITTVPDQSPKITEHVMYCIIHKKEHLVFKLFEVNPDCESVGDDDEKKEIKDTRTILNLMFEGSVFDSPVTPLKIYKRCRLAFPSNSLCPRHVQQVLEEMVQKRSYPKLKRKYFKSLDSIAYEKVFKL